MTLSPSSAARRVACAGSYIMERLYPPLEDSSPASREGDAAHALAAVSLAGGDFEKATIDVENSMISVTGEMLEAVELYRDDVNGVMAGIIGGAKSQYLHIETPLHIRLIHPDCRGTPDCWALIGNDVYVWDFKYGHSPVEVFENWQLLEYAAGIIEHLPHYKDGTIEALSKLSFHLRIVQPRSFHQDGPVREWVLSYAELWKYIERLRVVEDHAVQPDALCTPSPQCHFCSARRACPALSAAALTAVDVSVENQPAELGASQLGFELKYLKRAHKLLESRITGLEQQAIAQIKRGDRVPFYTLDNTRGRHRWVKPTSEVIALGQLIGVELQKPPDVITPKQAIDRGLPADLIKQYAEITPGEMKLAEITEQNLSKIFNHRS